LLPLPVIEPRLFASGNPDETAVYTGLSKALMNHSSCGVVVYSFLLAQKEQALAQLPCQLGDRSGTEYRPNSYSVHC
jgi:hypothetical protein